jgi:hypothetical protein
MEMEESSSAPVNQSMSQDGDNNMAPTSVPVSEPPQEESKIHPDDREAIHQGLIAALELHAYIDQENKAGRGYDGKRALQEISSKEHYRAFIQKYPLVMQHMCNTQAFNGKIFVDFAATLRKNPDAAKQERKLIALFINEYELPHVKLAKPDITPAQLQSYRRQLNNMYNEAIDKRQEAVETAEKKFAEQEKLIKELYLQFIIDNINADNIGKFIEKVEVPVQVSAEDELKIQTALDNYEKIKNNNNNANNANNANNGHIQSTNQEGDVRPNESQQPLPVSGTPEALC